MVDLDTRPAQEFFGRYRAGQGHVFVREIVRGPKTLSLASSDFGLGEDGFEPLQAFGLGPKEFPSSGIQESQGIGQGGKAQIRIVLP